MLYDSDRVAYYQRQNGYGERLTPKQRRRVNKKRRAQSPEAQTNRQAAHSQRMALIEARRRARIQLPAS